MVQKDTKQVNCSFQGSFNDGLGIFGLRAQA